MRAWLEETLHPAELPRRFRVVLCVLPTYGETHCVSLSDITPDHTLMCNVFTHLPLQVRLDLDPAQRIHARMRVGGYGWGWTWVEEFVCANELTQRSIDPWRLETGRSERCTRNDWSGRRGGQESSERNDLIGCELPDFAGVVDL